ncbi:MAG: ribosome small subunit-dependent GTPase A [Proteobacteria bacterium]|nr:ribosome small subunit-dependent GTPase A [Pseudomonadota bacterium]
MHEILTARVIATHGRHLVLADASGRELAARPFGRDLTVVCGDEVQYRIDAHHDEAHVLAVGPRHATLWRTNIRGGAEPVAANLTRLLVVLAPLPVPDLFVVDRYLAAATSVDLPATVVLNKADLDIPRQLHEQLDAYVAAQYGRVLCSADSGAGIDDLAALLPAGARACLVGQSGVGKSSLVKCLLPTAAVGIGALVREEEGRHTTTAARLFPLPTGAGLIDSPGVRDFAPALAALDERTLGFPEVARLAGACRFADCRHMREPDCAVRAAVDGGSLAPRRYESYRRLRRLREDLEPRRRGRH